MDGWDCRLGRGVKKDRVGLGGGRKGRCRCVVYKGSGMVWFCCPIDVCFKSHMAQDTVEISICSVVQACCQVKTIAIL